MTKEYKVKGKVIGIKESNKPIKPTITKEETIELLRSLLIAEKIRVSKMYPSLIRIAQQYEIDLKSKEIISDDELATYAQQFGGRVELYRQDHVAWALLQERGLLDEKIPKRRTDYVVRNFKRQTAALEEYAQNARTLHTDDSIESIFPDPSY